MLFSPSKTGGYFYSKLKNSKLSNSLYLVSIIRGLVTLLVENKLLIPTFAIDIIANILAIHSPENELPEPFFGIGIFIFLAILYIVLSSFVKKHIIRIKEFRQYHGAEHKVLFTNSKDKDMTFVNCRNAPRIYDSCGTILLSMLILTVSITQIIKYLLFKTNMWFSIHFIIAYCLAFELFLSKRNTPIIRFVYKLGHAFQKYAVTSEPTNLQLSQAIYAFILLEKAETGEIPESMLNNIFKNDKVICFTKHFQ